MDWTEEKYVKLYQRDTVTWLGWPWEGRCVLPLLLRKVDGAGLLAHGSIAPAVGIGLLIGVPVAVVEVALAAFLADGTALLTPAGVLLPKFLDAQEARKSDALRARESRERRRNDAKSGEAASHGVTRRHEPSQPVTLQPSPAQPSPTPAQKSIAGKKPPADPRLGPLQSWLIDVYAQERKAPYKHGGAKDVMALKALLPLATDAEISDRWRFGLRATGWASCSTFAQLGSKWNDLGAPVPTRAGGLMLPVVPSEQGHTTRDLTETF